MSAEKAPARFEECLENLKYTREFDIYLDMLDLLKNEYLIFFYLRNTSGQNFPDEIVKKIRSLGLLNFTTEPAMKYEGVIKNGAVSRDSALTADLRSGGLTGSVLEREHFMRFKMKEVEIKIDDKEQSLSDEGLNIVVYDMKSSKTIDASCYNAIEGNPTFYHRNFYYDEQYIESHIYVPDSCKEAVTLPLRRSYFSNRKLNVREVERGIFLPTRSTSDADAFISIVGSHKAYGGVCDENFNFIAGHRVFNPRTIELDGRHIIDSYAVEPEKITYVDETVLFGGSLLEHPGHLIIECFADRLWWLAQNTDSNIKIAIELLGGKSQMDSVDGSFSIGLFEAFGISEDRIIIIKNPTQFKKIIIPDQSAIPLNYCFPYEFTKEYILPFQHIKKQLTPGKYKKIYLTRSKVYSKNAIGEEYFIDFFEKKGFKIIHPEDYSMKEKAELMYGADEVVTIDGTNALFAIFCRPSVKLTVLTRRMDFWDTPLQLVVESVGIKEFFLVNVSGNFLENFSGSDLFSYAKGLTLAYASRDFQKYVKYIYNEELDITPEESLKKYIYEYLTKFSEHYSNSHAFIALSNIKVTDILRSVGEIFVGKEPILFKGGAKVFTDDEVKIINLEQQFRSNKISSAEKIKELADKAKEYIEENQTLKKSLAQLETENQQLRSQNSEMASYMAEISVLLDALESQGAPEE